MFIGIPLVGRNSFRFIISDEVNGESTISNKGLIRRIFGSENRGPGW